MASFNLPRDIESYIQESGGAGHDNLPSLAKLIRKVMSGTIIESSMRICTYKLVVEDVLFSNFDEYQRVFTQCEICSKVCDCNKCAEKRNTFVFLKKHIVSEDIGISFNSFLKHG